MTEKLYYIDSYIKSFEAEVVSCEQGKKGYEVVLDKTAFYPEGGGQPADNGILSGAIVSDVRIKNKLIYHVVDRPLEVGSIVKGDINFDRRFDMMQQHSGEHIVSGIINSKYGYNNVGFHLNNTYMTADIDGELTEEQVKEIEILANKAVYENIEIDNTIYPNEEVKDKVYRSKIELNEDVRLVKVGSYDTCACCGTHVKQTGEIGIIKFVDSVKHRGGTRLTLLCGNRAVQDYSNKQDIINKAMGALSASPDKINYQIERLQKEVSDNKLKQKMLIDEMIDYKISKYLAENKDAYLVYEDIIGADEIRRMCVSMTDKTNKSCMIICMEGDKIKYVIGNKDGDIREFCKSFNTKFNGKGGGNAQLCQGSVEGDISEIKNYIENNLK